MLVEILVLIVLIIANGFFAMSEFAVVSARKAILLRQAKNGESGAEEALGLIGDLSRFLSTIQIGITIIGILAGAFAGVTIAREIAARVLEIPALAPHAEAIGVGVVVLVITYATLVFGELVPKQIGLAYPERIASLVSAPMRLLSWISLPVVSLLSFSTGMVLRVLGISWKERPSVTEEEVRDLIREGARVGVFKKEEHEIIRYVFRMADQCVRAVLTPRPTIVGIDLDDPVELNMARIAESEHALFPVFREDLDALVGVISVRDIWARMLSGEPVELESLVRSPFIVPESAPILKVLEIFRDSGAHMVLVTDEYGSIQGLVTLHDILESIVGEIPSTPEEREEIRFFQREDGSWLIDGLVGIAEFKEKFGIESLPGEEKGYYTTLGGFIIRQLERIPLTGDKFVWGDLRFEVVDMDKKRVDKVLVS
ncbi:MAG: hemolysin family protein, partial [Methanomicrobiaceae archaeon]|nr:hemolysin family protein [Methanomicrobiaceae archaeon]